MPAHAIQLWRQEERDYVLPEQVTKIIDACETERPSSRKHLKQFFIAVQLPDFSEIDYPLREAYREYLESTLRLKKVTPYLTIYDRVKQASIREQMKTLTGRKECQWRLEEKVLFIPYHSDQKLAAEFDNTRRKDNLVWDFAQPAPWHLKEQIFTALNAILQEKYRTQRRSEHLMGLQNLYRLCVQNSVEDIELLDAEQEQALFHSMDEPELDQSKQQKLQTALNLCRKAVFLQNPEIN